MLRGGNAPSGAEQAAHAARQLADGAAAGSGHAAQHLQQQQQPQRPPRVLEALYGCGEAVRSLEDGLLAAAAAVGCGPQLAAALR